MNLRDELFPEPDRHRYTRRLPANEWTRIQAQLDQDRAQMRDIVRREQPWRRDLRDPAWEEFREAHPLSADEIE